MQFLQAKIVTENSGSIFQIGFEGNNKILLTVTLPQGEEKKKKKTTFLSQNPFPPTFFQDR